MNGSSEFEINTSRLWDKGKDIPMSKDFITYGFWDAYCEVETKQLLSEPDT